MTTSRRRVLTGTAAVIAALGALASGCSSTAPTGTQVHVTLQDFTVHESPATVPAGRVTFDVRNAGPSTHEFKVARTDLAASVLPLTAGGLSVNDDSPRLHQVAGLDAVDLGASKHLTVDLGAGHYVVYCNFEGHYLGGTRAQFDVVRKGSR